jgi:hypothetical protein
MKMENKASISKETFCAALRMIREQEKTYDDVTTALQKVMDGHFIFGSDNKWLEALLLVMKEAVHDQYDYIGWWLYEAAEDYMVWEDGENGKKWCLKEPEALYDYIVEECQN